MVRRVILGVAAALSFVPTLFVVQGCIIGDDGVWRLRQSWGGWEHANCDPCEPFECCPCPWPESCAWPNTPPVVPDWCDDWRADGGNLCNEGGADSGMSSFCSSGACVPSAPDGWKHVAFFYDWASETRACPEEAPHLVFEGSPAPADRLCPKCSCDAPEGKCNIPTTWTVKTVGCDDPAAAIETNFDAPNGWDGMCSDANAIAQGKLCGGIPCVRSVTIAPPVIEEKPCVAHAEGETELPVPKAWGGEGSMPIGRACASEKPLPSCSGQGCTSTNTEFGACIMRAGDEVCPDGWNGDRHVLYGAIDDARECSPCGCEAPKGSVCQVKWRTFPTSSCSVENAEGDVYSGVLPGCANLMPGVALAGKTAELINYTKGSCTPNGGDLVGELKLDKPHTICCHASTM